VGVSIRFQRWGQPAQQQGRRMPLRILSRPTATRRHLVSSFFADVTQQIHSLRASGVISAHTFVTIGSDAIALRKSAGILCGAELWFLFMTAEMFALGKIPGPLYLTQP